MQYKNLLGSISLLALCATSALASGVLQDSYAADKTFQSDPNLTYTSMNVAWNGSEYFSASGGYAYGTNLARYDASGALQQDYAPGLDLRSIFTDASGTLYGRSFADSTIYKMTSPGVFTSAVVLAGGLDAQSSVALANGGNEYIAMSNGTVNRWDLSGNALAPVYLNGFGTVGSEGSYPNSRGIAAVGNYYLTFADQNLYAWDTSGNRVGQGSLLNSGTSFDSGFSFGYAADGRVWINDVAGGTTRGYNLGAVPEPSSLLGLAGLGVVLMRRRNRK